MNIARTTLRRNQCGVNSTSGCRSDTPVSSGLSSIAGNGGELRLRLILLLLLNLLGIAVEEHVDHDVPALGGTGDGAAEAQDLAGKEPPHETNRVARLVVRGDRNVDELKRRVGVAEGDNGDVDVGRLADGLVVDAGVGHDDQTGLLERAGDVVGEATGGETAGNRLCAGVGSVLQDCTVAVWARRDDTDVVGVLDRGDDTGGEDELLPGLANVEDVDA